MSVRTPYLSTFPAKWTCAVAAKVEWSSSQLPVSISTFAWISVRPMNRRVKLTAGNISQWQNVQNAASFTIECRKKHIGTDTRGKASHRNCLSESI